MRAVLCKEYGPPESLVVEEADSPAVGARQVRIGVRACGVNFPDLLIIKGEYQFKPPMPFSPGGEVAGEVLEVGSEVKSLEPGDRVMAMTGWGGFAQEVVAEAAQCMPIPSGMDDVTAAAFSMTYGTSYHALVQRGALQAGETLLVHGAAGGVGTAAVEIGKALGAKVIATGGSDDKLAKLQEHFGLEGVVNYRTETLKERVKAMTGGEGADVIYDPVGGEITEQSLRCIRWKGRLLIIGFASGEIPKVRANLVLLKGCSVVGVFWGAFAGREPKVNEENFRTLFALYEEGKLKPMISHTFPLDRAAEALNALANREVIGKAVLTV